MLLWWYYRGSWALLRCSHTLQNHQIKLIRCPRVRFSEVSVVGFRNRLKTMLRIFLPTTLWKKKTVLSEELLSHWSDNPLKACCSTQQQCWGRIQGVPPQFLGSPNFNLSAVACWFTAHARLPVCYWLARTPIKWKMSSEVHFFLCTTPSTQPYPIDVNHRHCFVGPSFTPHVQLPRPRSFCFLHHDTIQLRLFPPKNTSLSPWQHRSAHTWVSMYRDGHGAEMTTLTEALGGR